MMMHSIISSLSNLQITPVNCEILGSMGLCEAIANILAFFIVNPNNLYTGGLTGAVVRIVELALQVVRDFAVEEENRSKLGAAGCCASVLLALRGFGLGMTGLAGLTGQSVANDSSGGRPLDPAGSGAAATLNSNEGGIGGVDTATTSSTTSIATFSNDRIPTVALEALYNLTASGQFDNSAIVGQLGGVEVVIQTLRTYAHTHSILAYGCGVLRNLCLNDDDSRIRFINAGGVALLCDTLRDHYLDSDAVVEFTCVAVVDLISLHSHLFDTSLSTTSNTTGTATLDFKELFLAAGILDIVKMILNLYGLTDDYITKEYDGFSDFRASHVDYVIKAYLAIK
jgi:hypothetical protein